MKPRRLRSLCYDSYCENLERLAQLDPLWVILTHSGKQFGAWQPNEFFQTGEREVSAVLHRCRELQIAPKNYDRALDFGCGVGRLTRAWASWFSECVGVDVSSEMVSRARELNRGFSNCKFIANDSDNLPFSDCAFDFVSSFIVLQHLRSERQILRFVAEFVRVLRPGGVIVFQLPDKPSFRRRIQGRRRLWSLLHALGLREKFLYEKLELTPIRMEGVSAARMRGFLENLNVKVVRIDEDKMAGAHYRSYTYFAVKEGPR